MDINRKLSSYKFSLKYNFSDSEVKEFKKDIAALITDAIKGRENPDDDAYVIGHQRTKTAKGFRYFLIEIYLRDYDFNLNVKELSLDEYLDSMNEVKGNEDLTKMKAII